MGGPAASTTGRTVLEAAALRYVEWAAHPGVTAENAYADFNAALFEAVTSGAVPARAEATLMEALTELGELNHSAAHGSPAWLLEAAIRKRFVAEAAVYWGRGPEVMDAEPLRTALPLPTPEGHAEDLEFAATLHDTGRYLLIYRPEASLRVYDKASDGEIHLFLSDGAAWQESNGARGALDAGPDGRAEVTLDDGTRLMLDPAAGGMTAEKAGIRKDLLAAGDRS